MVLYSQSMAAGLQAFKIKTDFPLCGPSPAQRVFIVMKINGFIFIILLCVLPEIKGNGHTKGDFMNDNKISFLVYGAFFSVLPVIYLFNFIINQTPLPILTFYSLIIIAVMSFSFSYLSVNFRKNNKVEKRSIIKKGIITGFIVMFISIAVTLPVVALNLFDIHLLHLFMILFTILISSAFISTVVYTKKSLGTR